MEKRVAILLTIHNRKTETLNCLKKIHELILPKDISFDCYLVDDNSTDNSIYLIRATYPDVKIIAGNGKLYWNRGMHLAWKSAMNFIDYDFYLWLNNDTFLFENALVELLNCYNLSNAESLICGTTCDLTLSNFTYGGRTHTGQPIIPNLNLQKCEIINGNVVLVSRFICNKIGILDPIFPHAIGDHEYGLRVIKSGLKIYTTRRYIGICEPNNSLPQWCYSKVAIKERFKSLYSPLGNSHPYYFFIYEYRYFGLVTAIKHYLSIHLRALLPSLWK
jgi:GT2 family glycosyltransferase